MSEWRQVFLDDVAREVTVGHVGPMKSEYVEEGVPFLRSQDIRPHWIDTQDIAYVSQQFHERLSKSALAPGDVVTVRTGKPGTTAVVPSSLPVANCSDLVITRVGPDVDPNWLSYYINEVAKGHVSAHLVGAVQQHFNVGAAKEMMLVLPPLWEQRAIAEVLGALDDKIAANTRIAATADELIRNRYFAHEVGGLETCKVGDLAENVRVQVRPGEATLDAPYVGLEHVPRRHMFLHEMGYASEVTSAKAAFEANDVLFGKLRPYFHKVVSAPMEGICSTDILVLRACDPELAGFLLAAASSDSVIAECSAHSQGTRMPRTNWKDLSACEVRWPGTEAAREMSRDISGLTDLMTAKSAENGQLARTRDALLPLLMSGRVTVKDAEKVVEGVA